MFKLLKFENLSYSVLPESDSIWEWMVQTAGVLIMYYLIYFGFAALFEITNPKSLFGSKLSNKVQSNDTAVNKIEMKERQKRNEMIPYSIYYSVIAVTICVIYAMAWIHFVDPVLPYYGYYAKNNYGVTSFITELLVYMFLFDAWFYFTHRLLHLRKPFNFWHYIHKIHHRIVYPTAFAQDATHPFEALLQGPMGHHLINLVYPIHPVSHAVFGFLTAVFAIAAHDARQYDLNNHHHHHFYAHVNFGLYWPLWDWVFNTRYQEGKYKRVTSIDE